MENEMYALVRQDGRFFSVICVSSDKAELSKMLKEKVYEIKKSDEVIIIGDNMTLWQDDEAENTISFRIDSVKAI